MPSVLAIGAHHDDIEFLMAGTMLRLRDLGWDVHYMNVADGSRGSTVMGREEIATMRLAEAKAAAKLMGATFHDPICPDMEIAYTTELLRKVAAVVRQAKPSVLLTHSPSCYMEDHENASRLAVSAAFAHAMPNFESDPEFETYDEPLTVYHCQPIGNRHPLGDVVVPHFYVDVTSQLEEKTAALACHASQKEWLDKSQGMNSYLQTMRDVCSETGQMSGKFKYAEGWRRREHWGFCGPNDDPLADAFGDGILDMRDNS